MLEPYRARLEKHEPVHDQLRGPDLQEQNIFLRLVGPAALQDAYAPDQSRFDGLGPQRDLPILGGLGSKQCIRRHHGFLPHCYQFCSA